MNTDITPELIEEIKTLFARKVKESVEIKELIKATEGKQISHELSYKFAELIGQYLSETFRSIIIPNKLPDDRMYYNIAERVINDSFNRGYRVVTDYASIVQEVLNTKAGLGIKAIKPKVNKHYIESLINEIDKSLSLDDTLNQLDESTITYMLKLVDEFIKEQVEFHGKAGLKPVIKRTATSGACSWCKSKEGTYSYPTDNEVYSRHKHCRCTVVYDPRDARSGVQNVHTKVWTV